MGSITNNNHYLSQCISKNFKVDRNAPFWEYDFSTCLGPKMRSVDNLFSGRRLWDQELENVINTKMENDLSRLVTVPIVRRREIKDSAIVEAQFNGVFIDTEEDCKILSKLLLQTAMLQRSRNSEIDEVMRNKFSSDSFLDGLYLGLFEINPMGKYPPLILTDGMMFMFMAPEINTPGMLGHLRFMVSVK